MLFLHVDCWNYNICFNSKVQFLKEFITRLQCCIPIGQSLHSTVCHFCINNNQNNNRISGLSSTKNGFPDDGVQLWEDKQDFRYM